MFTAKVITVSDRCSRGERTDESGPAIVALLKDEGYFVAGAEIVPDEMDAIKAALVSAANERVALVVTTGGTGFAPRDVTPEATEAVSDKIVPGIGEAMRAVSFRLTPRAILSRATAGIRDKTLIINLPGSPKAARENWAAVAPAISHGLEMLCGGQADCAKLSDR